MATGRLLSACLFFSFLSDLSLAISTVPVPNEHAKHVKTKFDDYSEHFLLPDDFETAAKTPVTKPTAEEIESMQNSLLFEGDIMGVPSLDEQIIRRRLRDDPAVDDEEIFRRPFHSSLNLVTYPDKLWPEGRVPYMLEEGMTPEQRASIAQAFDEYKEKTCVRFVPRTDDDFDYIYLKRNVGFGCSSYVGRAGGNQTISLEVDKCFSKGIICHELLHCLGFFHEHSRTDRDQFVDIKEENIRPGMMRNFEKYPRKIIDPLGMPYDYDSVMHYHKLAFSRNGKPTIVPKDEKAEVGQRYKLSKIDAQKVNKLYKCDMQTSTPKTSTTTTESNISNAKTTEKLKTTTTQSTTTTTSTEPTTTSEEIEQITKYKGRTTVTSTSSSTTPSTTTQVIKTRRKCEDLNAHCNMWEQLGHCEHSTKYMSHYCRKACHMCNDGDLLSTTSPATSKEKETETKSECVDRNLFCGYWAKLDECKSDSKFMKIFCKASCGRC